MKKKWGATWLLIAMIMGVMITSGGNELLRSVQRMAPADILVLDPGHGGLDGGAVGAKGISEKDINLAIACAIASMAEADGWKVVMTRVEDKGLYSDVDNDGTENMKIQNHRSVRSLKTEDLKERKKLIEKIKPLLAVSIHLNSFKEDRSVHGAQTFYPVGSGEDAVLLESKVLAEHIQESLIGGLMDGTHRAPLGKRDVMLFKNPAVPLVIVECGFLSNAREEALLEEKAYQQKIAECIYQGILNYTGKGTKEFLEIVDNRG